jgi:hypothetical protein
LPVVSGQQEFFNRVYRRYVRKIARRKFMYPGARQIHSHTKL